jgi:large subunit ribosomal protein L17
MRHRVAGRKLGRVTSHRLATLRNLTTSLFERERIRTTLMKAKELRPFAEKLITMSKKGGLHRRRLAARQIHDARILRKLFDTYAARFLDRPGGYTRILKLGPRKGDGAEMAIVEMVGSEALADKKSGAKGKAAKPDKKARSAAKG